MPDIIITLTPASTLTRGVDALCGLNGYQTLINGVANPETRNAFAKRMLANWLKGEIARWETPPAVVAAEAAVRASVDSLSIT